MNENRLKIILITSYIKSFQKNVMKRISYKAFLIDLFVKSLSEDK